VKKVIFIICCLFLTVSNTYALDINSKYAVLYNLNDNQVIYEQNKDERTSIASLTKIMTTLVAIENISDFNEKVTIKNSMFDGLYEANAAVIGLKHNQVVTYNDLLYGLFLGSGADAGRALTISIAGSEEKFVELMNKKAQELHLQNTHYENIVGLDEEGHYSTVEEVAQLLKIAYENEKFQEIFKTSSYTLSDHSLTVTSTFRKTAKTYGLDSSFILGAKTGYTYAAGRCLASIAVDEQNQITYLLVTTNASKTPYHIKDAITTYQYYFENYGYHELVEENQLLVTLPTKYSNTKEVSFYADKNIQKYLNNEFSKKDVTLNYQGKSEITPTMKKNTRLGEVEVIYKGEKIDTIEILLTSAISYSALGFITAHKIIFISIAVILFLFLSLFIIRIRNLNKRKKHKKTRRVK